MSEALRALADAPDSAFEPEPSPDQIPSQEIDSAATAEEAPQQVEPEAQPAAEQRPKEAKKLSKTELEKRSKERDDRDRRRADQAYAKLQQQEAQAQALFAENARLKAEAARAAEQAKIQTNPILKEAVGLLEAGYKAEDVEAEANRLDANGDHEGARGARAIAIQMRNQVQASAQAQAQAQAEQAQTQWRSLQFGTPEFDQASMHLKQGTKEFDDCWGTCEQNLIERAKASSDPIDQEIARTFRDRNSPFGRKMTEFLNTTAFGHAFKRFALGIMPAYDLVKNAMVMEHQNGIIQRLTKENAKLRGLTSIGLSAPADYVNGHTQASHLDPDLSYEEFTRLPVDKMRERLRARERG